tara:strand:- start:54 stop:500 length:447 start_codon:yes stop_codon:yes gene_type:complete
MSSQFLNQDYPCNASKINNVVINEVSRDATFHNQLTSATTTVDVLGSTTFIVQTQQFTTPHDQETRFTINNLGDKARSSWKTGDIVKCNILTYSGFNGLPVVSGEKLTGGGYSIRIANVVKTGTPPANSALNGQFQISVELYKFNNMP